MNNRQVSTYKPRKEFVQESLFDLNAGTENRQPSVLSKGSMGDELLVSLLALASIKGLGFKTLCAMFDTGFLTKVWDWDLAEVVRHWASLPTKPKADMSKTIHEEQESLLETGRNTANDLRKQEVSFIPLGHPSYPESLLKLSIPPRWLFVKGNLTEIHPGSIIAVVGTRNASCTGEKMAYRFAMQLVLRNAVVLSGLAKGIDEQAHLGAVDHFGQTIAILGHGLADHYLNRSLCSRILESGGVIVSEYLPSDPPSRQGFLRRNELQAAMSKVVVPIECPSLESGTGATVRRAMKVGTPIVGIVTDNMREKAFLETKRNLESLGHPVFSDTDDFWAYLREKMTEHNWTIDPVPRQNRFFRGIEQQMSDATDRVSLDEKSVDRLAQRLKKIVRDRRMSRQEEEVKE